MSHENSQLDIPDRPLLGPSPHPSVWTEIGEAQITHTIFGRAKVRIIRKHDKLHRALWLLAIVAATAAAWQGWRVLHPADSQQSADSLSSDSVNERLNSPDLQSGDAAPSPAAAAKEEVPATIPQSEPDKPAVDRIAPPPVGTLKGGGQMAIKPQSAPTAATATRNPPVKPLMHKPLPTTQPTTQAVAAPRVIQPAAQSAASSPAGVVPSLAAPIQLDNPATEPPANAPQPAQPAGLPGK